MVTTANDWPVRTLALSRRLPKRLNKPSISPADTEYFDIFSPPPGDREVISQVDLLSSKETKIAHKSVRTAIAASGWAARTGAIAEFWRWPEGSGDGGLGLGGRWVGGDFDPVGESDTLNELGQLIVAIEPTPAFLRSIDQLEHHRQRRLVREAALRADRAVSHGGKGAFDRVRGPQVFPVFGREIVKREQDLAILRQAIGGLLVFQLVGGDEGVERSLGVLAGL